MGDEEALMIVIPAAGRGSRLAPLSDFTPKEMLPIAGVPALVHALDEAAGLADSLHVVTRPGGATSVERLIATYMSSVPGQRRRIGITVQPVPAGLADAIGSPTPKDPSTRIVILPDELVEGCELVTRMLAIRQLLGGSVLALRRLQTHLRAEKGSVSVAKHPRRSDVLRVGEAFDGVDPNASELSIIGRYVLEPALVDLIPDLKVSSRGELDMCDLINLGIRKGLIFHAVEHDGVWFDIGTIDAYEAAFVAMSQSGSAGRPQRLST